MTIPDSPLLFLAMVAIISLSGVIMPGPVFAATVAKGYNDVKAGLKIAAGHAIVEIPLIAAIFLGFDTVLNDRWVFATVGIVGGILLLVMGIGMIRSRERLVQTRGETKYSSFMAGILTTAANPYFFLWWATVGAALITGAVQFGLLMLPVFAVVHISCDFGWDFFISATVNRSRKLWSEKRHHYLFAISGAIMLFFSLYFIATSLIGLV
ncbi:MAG: LysE family translocator [Methanomassiliicoccales archaeon]|nr:LysE family translocator [Methanomassiliicoccales archaeon]